MRKLYFKKLISILGHLALCLIIYWLGITFISIIANFFKNWFVRFCIGFGIPLALVLIRVHNRRLDNQEMRRAYLAEANRERLVLKEEWYRICKFPHFLAEVLAFATIDLVVTIVACFMVIAPWWFYIYIAFLLFVVPSVLFFIGDFALWLKVHDTWRRDA